MVPFNPEMIHSLLDDLDAQFDDAQSWAEELEAMQCAGCWDDALQENIDAAWQHVHELIETHDSLFALL